MPDILLSIDCRKPRRWMKCFNEAPSCRTNENFLNRLLEIELFVRMCLSPQRPQHFLYFLPLPQGQGSLRPTFSGLLGFGVCVTLCLALNGSLKQLHHPISFTVSSMNRRCRSSPNFRKVSSFPRSR